MRVKQILSEGFRDGEQHNFPRTSTILHSTIDSMLTQEQYLYISDGTKQVLWVQCSKGTVIFYRRSQHHFTVHLIYYIIENQILSENGKN
jgi:hypothetical protein